MIPNSLFGKSKKVVRFAPKVIDRCTISATPPDVDAEQIRLTQRQSSEIKFLMQWPRVELMTLNLPKGFLTGWLRDSLFFRACPSRQESYMGWIRCYPCRVKFPECKRHDCAVFETDVFDGWGVESKSSSVALILPRLCGCFTDVRKGREVSVEFRAV
jgi:hypothetical protein